MSRLWMEESDGERWLINPALIVANPRKKRGTKMAYRRKARRNRMPAGLARYWAKHRRKSTSTHRRRRRSVMSNPRRRRRARRNYASAGMVAMNPRRRHVRRNRVHHRRRRFHARRNPSLMGFALPPTMDIVGVGAGLVVPPMLANYLFNNFVAGTSMGTSRWAYLGVEAVSVAVPAMVVRKFVNVRMGNMMLLGGVARLALDLVQMLAPTLLPSVAAPTGLSGGGAQGQPFLGMYERMPSRRTLSGMGKYYNRSNPNSMMGSGSMIQNVPDRLDPAYRF
jgi:hypothetical protein